MKVWKRKDRNDEKVGSVLETKPTEIRDGGLTTPPFFIAPTISAIPPAIEYFMANVLWRLLFIPINSFSIHRIDCVLKGNFTSLTNQLFEINYPEVVVASLDEKPEVTPPAMSMLPGGIGCLVDPKPLSHILLDIYTSAINSLSVQRDGPCYKGSFTNMKHEVYTVTFPCVTIKSVTTT